MSIIRKGELRQMDDESLNKKLVEITREILSGKGGVQAARRPKNSKHRELRKTKARILTLLSQRGRKTQQ